MHAGDSIGYFSPRLIIFEATETQHHSKDQISFYKNKELLEALT